MNAPDAIIALAKLVGATPLAWRETPTSWVIVFNDGRKLEFEKKAEAVGTVGGEGEPQSALASPENAPRARKTKNKEKIKNGTSNLS